MRLIGTAHITGPGKHVGFYDVFEIDTGSYYAHPRNGWQTKYTPVEWEEFYFAKVGRHWLADPVKWNKTAAEIAEQLSIK